MDLKNGIAIRFRQGQVRVKKKKTYLGAFLGFKGKKGRNQGINRRGKKGKEEERGGTRN